MSGYPINLSNGTLITTVNPGTFNTTTFNIALLGRGVANYGEVTAENFVHMLENFAANQPPGANPNLTGAPTTGQLWYDTANKVLKVYDNTTIPNWRSLFVNTNNSFIAPNGSEPNPGISFEGSNNSGFYFVTPNTIGISILGNNILNINPQGMGFPDGTAPAPSIYFKNDSDTGIYRPGANQIGFSTNGQQKFRIEDSKLLVQVPMEFFSGSETNPIIAFSADPDTGIYRSGTDEIALTANGTRRLVATATGGIFYGSWTLGTGATLQATYADLAERYHADEPMQSGDVVCLGGEKEITKSREEYDTNVFGVISENPAFGMNQHAGNNDTHPYVALTGRVKVKVVGHVKKGQRLVTSKIPGVAQAAPSWITDWRMILGRALQNKENDDLGYIEIVVGAK